METVDLKRQWRHLYAPKPGRFELVDVPELPFLAIDGRIEPGSSPGTSEEFAASTGALYGLAYTLKFTFKKRADAPLDYPVMPLEGLWWVEDGRFDLARPDNWHYTLMILLPEVVGEDDVVAGIAALRAKRGNRAEFTGLRLEQFTEGPCAQVMHIGPYATEPETMEGLPPFLATEGLVDLVGSAGGKHHEIYLSDPGRTDPSRLKTILRHPVGPAT
ncbi:MAG TPA: GyrI-like domain-containing protein [Propionicimonas sp.]|nr:GyrI-like domain-containing protein [Propionicimonas sp.]